MKVVADVKAADPTLDFELECFGAGASLVIGIDEVGRGAIAGPVAVGAHVVAAGVDNFPEGLRDSKLLSEKKRESLAPLIAAWGHGAVGFISSSDIDEHGISWALGQAGRLALLELHQTGLDIHNAVILVDGKFDWLSPQLRTPLNVHTMVGADRSCASVAAASVRAKVARDAQMRLAHDRLPHYGWNANKGYGSKAHYEGIATHGVSELHRKTWVH